MILAFLLALVAFAALLPVILPLLRRGGTAAARAAYDQAVYRDQLAELERDIARGLLTDTEAQAARLEIQRRLLAADAAETVASPDRIADAAEAEPDGRANPVLALLVALVVGGGSLGLYALLAPPTVSTLSAPTADDAQRAEVRKLVERLKERLAAEPSSVQGWQLYARASAGLGDWAEAIAAYRRLMELGETSAATLAGYGEVLTAQAMGTVTPSARQAFEAALAKEPDNGAARFYLAVAAGQGGEPARAIADLLALAGDLPADAPERPEIARRVAGFAQLAGQPAPPLPPGRPVAAPAGPPGPDADAAAAAENMPAVDRAAMIRGMVDRLAERLAREPNDLEGWLRLGQARAVLGEKDLAADAYERAAALKPADVTIPLRAVEALLQGLSMTDTLPPRAVAILRQVEAVRPDEPAVLWYLGLVAAREGQPDRTRAYWRRLLAQMPPDGEDTRMVKAALDALDRK